MSLQLGYMKSGGQHEKLPKHTDLYDTVPTTY